MRTTERELEERARRLEREVLTAVRYQRGLQIDENVHSVEHAVFMDFASGVRVAIGTGDELGLRHGFGVTVHERRVLDEAHGPIEDVSAAPRWSALLGRKITCGRIHWDDIYERLRPSLGIGVAIHADHLSRRDFPSTLEILFGDDSVLFSAAKRTADGNITPFVGELLVTFPKKTNRV